jgi:hypothetical protein
MQSKAKTAEQYIRELPEDRREIIHFLDHFIRRCVPDIEREKDTFMMYGMIGYGKFHYKSSRSKQEGDWAIIGLASQKNYISLYLCAADKDGYIAENNKDRLGKVSVGRSCIRFKKLEDLNLPVLEECIKKSVKLVRSGGFAM